MKNIYSNILKPNNKNLIKIINILQKDGVVGLPTETVYGLAGNAYSSKAIKKIYQLKKRPKKNPLIIHYLDAKNAEKDVILKGDNITDDFKNILINYIDNRFGNN